MPTINAIIFDLDSCLSAPDEVSRDLRDPGFQAIEEANCGRIAAEEMEQVRIDYWQMPFDKLAEKYRFTPEMTAAGWRVFSEMEVDRPMEGYPDLALLRDFPEHLFLVTTGFQKLQESKIRALGIRDLFREIVIDAIDGASERGKEAAFRRLMRIWELEASRVLIVGDNLASEIAAGNRLGCRTVQMIRAGVTRGDTATFVAHGLKELRELIESLDSAPAASLK